MYLKMYGGSKRTSASSFGVHLCRFPTGRVGKWCPALQADDRRRLAGCCRVQLDDRSEAGLHVGYRNHSPDNHEDGSPVNKASVHGRLTQGSSPQPLPLPAVDEPDGACAVGALRLQVANVILRLHGGVVRF